MNKLTLEAFQTFDEPSLIAAKREAREFINQVLKNPDGTGHTLSFLGQSGVGKTMLCRCILGELGKDPWHRLSRIPQSLIKGRIESHHFAFVDWRHVSDRFKQGDWSDVDRLESEYFVVIDDAGADYDPNSIAAQKLDRILRTRANKWTVTTCNLKLEQIGQQMDTRIASWLMRDENKVVEITAKDYALRNHADNLCRV